MARVVDEAAEFRAMLSKNLARLSDIASEWTSRLSETDRDWLTITALNLAFERRRQFDPRRRSLVLWFEACMQEAAEKRPGWKVWTINGYEWVSPWNLRQRR